MNNNFNPFQLLKEISESAQTGKLQFTGESVIWKFDFLEGKLQYATHSLQSGATIKHYLVRLGYKTAAKNLLTTKILLDHNQLTKQSVYQLVSQGYLDSTQKAKLMRELTQDCLQSFLCVTKGQYSWLSKQKIDPLNSSISTEETLLELPPLIQTLQNKLQQWQKLHPIIVSPHQRPYCKDLSLLKRSIPSGNLSLNLLRQLVKLMRGISIRELALFVKQDELKLAQLLYPYLKNNILQLYLPKSPLNLLPVIPASFSQPDQPSHSHPKTLTQTQSIVTSKPIQKKEKIVCIDDSSTMLDMIKNYLESEKYELLTMINPMECLSFLFKSKPNLILMDISMPGINGNRLCKILKASPIFKQVPIILISGNSKILNQEILETTGATDFLAKPFTQQSLLNMLKKHSNSYALS